jgi:anhydro-N-acetylmuramic acid kinase
MAEEDAIWALGCMSGTSMDGVDGAMVLTDGVEVYEFGATGFRPYNAREKAIIASAQGQWPNGEGVAEVEDVVRKAHQHLISRFSGVALVGYHGQTLAHDPDAGRTHQVGDGARLAREIGQPVAWDFRSQDVAAGGQGAPLAPFYHFALARRFALGRVCFLNLGGVGNITYVNSEADFPDQNHALVAFDTGPANALMDDFVHARTGLACDYGGAMAALGQADDIIVEGFMRHPYFAKKPPKSLDRNEFIGLVDAVKHLSDVDGLATLAAASVASISRSIDCLPMRPTKVLVCGGGRKNTYLMARLSQELPMPVEDIDKVGMDGDMLEAQAFAYLAVRVQNRQSLSAPGTTGVPEPMRGGRISQPTLGSTQD